MPCVFGCDEEVDSLHHYLRCEALWALVYTCTNSEAGANVNVPASEGDRYSRCRMHPQGFVPNEKQVVPTNDPLFNPANPHTSGHF